jgi:hypothetical protein
MCQSDSSAKIHSDSALWQNETWALLNRFVSEVWYFGFAGIDRWKKTTT